MITDPNILGASCYLDADSDLKSYGLETKRVCDHYAQESEGAHAVGFED